MGRPRTLKTTRAAQPGPPDARPATALLAEFAALRTEIANRTTAQTTLVSITLVAAAALTTLALDDGGNARIALFLGPLCTATGLLWLDNAHAIFQIGDYIRRNLWPRLRSAVDSDDLPSYEQFIIDLSKPTTSKTARRHRPLLILERGVLVFPFTVVFVLPSPVATTGVVWFHGGGWAWYAAGLNLALFAFMVTVWLRFLSKVLEPRAQSDAAPQR